MFLTPVSAAAAVAADFNKHFKHVSVPDSAHQDHPYPGKYVYAHSSDQDVRRIRSMNTSLYNVNSVFILKTSRLVCTHVCNKLAIVR